MLFGGPDHHLSSRHPPEQPRYADIVSNLAPRPSNGYDVPAQEPVMYAMVAQATLSKK